MYCVHCKECFSAHTSEKRFSHACKQEDLDKKLNGQAESDKITKILRRKRFQEYLLYKIRPLLKWRSLSTCDTMEDLIDLRPLLEALLEAEGPLERNPHLVGFEVEDGLAGVSSEHLMCVLTCMDDVDDVMQVFVVTLKVVFCVLLMKSLFIAC